MASPAINQETDLQWRRPAFGRPAWKRARASRRRRLEMLGRVDVALVLLEPPRRLDDATALGPRFGHGSVRRQREGSGRVVVQRQRKQRSRRRVVRRSESGRQWLAQQVDRPVVASSRGKGVREGRHYAKGERGRGHGCRRVCVTREAKGKVRSRIVSWACFEATRATAVSGREREEGAPGEETRRRVDERKRNSIGGWAGHTWERVPGRTGDTAAQNKGRAPQRASRVVPATARRPAASGLATLR